MMKKLYIMCRPKFDAKAEFTEIGESARFLRKLPPTPKLGVYPDGKTVQMGWAGAMNIYVVYTSRSHKQLRQLYDAGLIRYAKDDIVESSVVVQLEHGQKPFKRVWNGETGEVSYTQG